MLDPIPDTATESVRADELAERDVLLVPMTEAIETVAAAPYSSGAYAIVSTVEGGRYQWPVDDQIRVVTRG